MRERGIADQGNTTLSAENKFYNLTSAEPTNYWDHFGGNNPTYHYGSFNSVEFMYSPMMVTTATAMTDPSAPCCSLMIARTSKYHLT